MKRKLSEFYYNDISLSLLREQDLAETLHWRNQYREWFNDDSELSMESHRNWFTNYQYKDNDFVFIVKNHASEKVGQVAVYQINWETAQGEFGRFLVNPAYAGQQFMKRSCMAIRQLSAEVLNLQTLRLEVKPENHKAIHIYQTAGFKLSPQKSGENLIMTYHRHDYAVRTEPDKM